MSSIKFQSEPAEPPTDFYAPDEEKIRLLQSIIESTTGRATTLEEAEEVALQLISLYECLARDRTIITGNKNEQF